MHPDSAGMAPGSSAKMIDAWMVAPVAVVAVLAFGAIWRVQRSYVRKRGVRIENYLRQQKQEGRDDGRCSLAQLTAKLRMSERQVLDACSQNPAIMRLATTASYPGSVFADAPVFEYAPLRGRD
jgi:hypothetical protein